MHRLRSGFRHVLKRLTADPHVLLAVAVVLSALLIEVAASHDPVMVTVPSLVYLLVQTGLAFRSRTARSSAGDTGRLLLALGAVSWMSLQSGQLPLTILYLPIVAMAASRGSLQAFVLGMSALAAYVVAVVTAEAIEPGQLQRGVAVAVSMILLAVGTRRTVSSLERAVAHARAASAGQRRSSRQMAAVEATGRLLAMHGPTASALGEVMDLLVARFRYRFVSIYTVDGDLMRLGAQRGYDEVIETFDGSVGVVGRVMRTGEPALVRNVLTDPDYRAAIPDVRSEVSVPLRAGDALLGVLNVESGWDVPALDESDLATMIVVGDRVAAALALAQERDALRERAALFTRIAAFGSAVNASLDLATAHAAIVRAVADALETDIVALVLRDPATGDDRLASIHGGDERYIGVRIPPGEGLAGRAIAERRIVSSAAHGRADFPTTLRAARTEDVLAAAALPLLHEESVIGAIMLSRRDLARPYTLLELDALSLIASQVVLALANVSLHALVADAAIRDPLTGLWNRRYLEVSTARLFATRARMEPDERNPVAVIFFDLDHFGSFNKRHGHVTGDAVLRAFGAILAGRLRSSDIVARFGGEEFVAILDGASGTEAQRVAEEIRQEFESVRIEGVDGDDLRATVSAGCASLGPDVASLETMLEVADVALQMAKRGGRNQVVAA